MHEIERHVEVLSEMIEPALEVCVELVRIFHVKEAQNVWMGDFSASPELITEIPDLLGIWHRVIQAAKTPMHCDTRRRIWYIHICWVSLVQTFDCVHEGYSRYCMATDPTRRKADNITAPTF